MSAREGDSSADELLTHGPNHLTKAQVKPQQGLHFLKNISRRNGGVLRRLDKPVRRSLRSRLKVLCMLAGRIFGAWPPGMS